MRWPICADAWLFYHDINALDIHAISCKCHRRFSGCDIRLPLFKHYLIFKIVKLNISYRFLKVFAYFCNLFDLLDALIHLMSLTFNFLRMGWAHCQGQSLKGYVRFWVLFYLLNERGWCSNILYYNQVYINAFKCICHKKLTLYYHSYFKIRNLIWPGKLPTNQLIY